jgi:hypothetical protein
MVKCYNSGAVVILTYHILKAQNIIFNTVYKDDAYVLKPVN